MVPLPDGSPIPFATGTADATGHIVQTSGTQITLLPGTYLVTYHISAILLTAGYLQITPAYQGRGFLSMASTAVRRKTMPVYPALHPLF